MAIQLLSFNIHKGAGWTKRRNTLNQMREQFRVLKPDIIFLQEAYTTQHEFLAEEIWPHYAYGQNAIYAAGHHGNAILSKFPISYSQNIDISMSRYDRRGVLHSIAHPDHIGQPLHLLCLHLGLFKHYRSRQLEEVVSYVNTVIPKDELLIIGGDFNDWLDHASAPLIEGLGMQEAFLQQGGAYAKTFPAWAPTLKLDRIYTRGFETAEATRLIQSPWKPLSDHIALNVSLEPHVKPAK